MSLQADRILSGICIDKCTAIIQEAHRMDRALTSDIFLMSPYTIDKTCSQERFFWLIQNMSTTYYLHYLLTNIKYFKKICVEASETKTSNVFHKKLRMHRISLSAKMKNQQLVQWKGYIRIQAKRHILTYTDTNPVELSRAEIPYQPSKAQLGFHGGKKSTFLHTWKKSFLPPHDNINFLLKEKPEAQLKRIWTKKFKKKNKQSQKKKKKIKI